MLPCQHCRRRILLVEMLPIANPGTTLLEWTRQFVTKKPQDLDLVFWLIKKIERISRFSFILMRCLCLPAAIHNGKDVRKGETKTYMPPPQASFKKEAFVDFEFICVNIDSLETFIYVCEGFVHLRQNTCMCATEHVASCFPFLCPVLASSRLVCTFRCSCVSLLLPGCLWRYIRIRCRWRSAGGWCVCGQTRKPCRFKYEECVGAV